MNSKKRKVSQPGDFSFSWQRPFHEKSKTSESLQNYTMFYCTGVYKELLGNCLEHVRYVAKGSLFHSQHHEPQWRFRENKWCNFQGRWKFRHRFLEVSSRNYIEGVIRHCRKGPSTGRRLWISVVWWGCQVQMKGKTDNILEPRSQETLWGRE